MKVLTTVLMLALAGCGLVPQKVSMNDPRVQPLLTAAAAFDRTSYGFSPIPKNEEVRLELRPRNGYDAMLHIYGRTSRTIAFRRTKDGYRWIGDQETFTGPREYKSVDGVFREELCLTYEVEHISGFPINRLNISYRGEDPRLAWPREPTLEEVRPVLKEWGY